MREVELQDVVEIIAGQSPKSKYYNENGEGVPFFQGKSDFGDDYPTVTTWCTKPKKMAQKGDILFSVRAPVGPTNIANVDCCIGRGLSAIRPGGKIDRSFLRFYFKKVEQKISDRGRGSTFNAITQKDLKSLKIPLPTLDEQKAIVAKLDRAQQLIEIDKEMLSKYDELIRSVFLEMFGDPVTNPKGWEKKRLDEFSDVQIGPFGSLLHKEDYIKNGIPLVNPKHIVDSRIIPDEEKTITNKKAKELAKYILKENDIVLGRRGDMGRCAVVTSKENGYLCGTGSILIRSELNPILLSKILSSDSMVSHLEEVANGVTMKNLNSKIVSSLEIPIPPNETINQYEEVINFIDSEKLEQEGLLKKSEELFSSLVQEAFNQ